MTRRSPGRFRCDHRQEGLLAGDWESLWVQLLQCKASARQKVESACICQPLTTEKRITKRWNLKNPKYIGECCKHLALLPGHPSTPLQAWLVPGSSSSGTPERAPWQARNSGVPTAVVSPCDPTSSTQSSMASPRWRLHPASVNEVSCRNTAKTTGRITVLKQDILHYVTMCSLTPLISMCVPVTFHAVNLWTTTDYRSPHKMTLSAEKLSAFVLDPFACSYLHGIIHAQVLKFVWVKRWVKIAASKICDSVSAHCNERLQTGSRSPIGVWNHKRL